MSSAPAVKSSRSWAATAVLLALAYFFLYCLHPERPGIFADEANFSMQAFAWRQPGGAAGDWSSVFMLAPYIGALKSWIFAAVYRFAAPSAAVLRAVSLGAGAAFVAASACLAGLLAGPAAAAAAGLLIMADPAVFINVRHDYTGADIALTFLILAAMLLARPARGGSRLRPAAAGLCLGLALWSHLLVALPMIAAAAALALTGARRRDWPAIAGALLLGAAPLLLYYGFDPGGHRGWLLASFHSHESASWLGGLAPRAALLWDCLTSPAQAYGAFLPEPARGPGIILLWTWLAAAALHIRNAAAPRRWLILMPAISAALLCLVPSFYALHHVFLAVYPWIYLPMASLFSQAVSSGKTALTKRAALAAPAALCLAFSLRSTVWLRGRLLADAVRPPLTVQAQEDLAEFLDSRSEIIAPISPVSGVEVFTGGREAEDDSFSPFFLVPKLMERPALRAETARAMRAPGLLFLLCSDGISNGPFAAARRRFLLFSRQEGLEPVLVHQVLARPGGAPVFDFFRLVPGGPAARRAVP